MGNGNDDEIMISEGGCDENDDDFTFLLSCKQKRKKEKLTEKSSDDLSNAICYG